MLLLPVRRFPQVIAVLFIAFCLSSHSGSQALGQGMTAAEALDTVRRTGKPLLAIGTSPTCGPCLALKSIIHSDEKIKKSLDNFVYLEMSSRSDEFAQFRATYPGSYSGVPMVYLIRADGEVMYGQSGGMPAEQLQMLLAHGLENSGNVLTSNELKKLEKAYEVGREKAADGNLAGSLKLMSRIASQGSYADVIFRAEETGDQLTNLIAKWTEQLDKRIGEGDSVHANTYRLAELYVELPESAEVLKANVRHVLDFYESQERTRNAVLQNKRLVRARLEEGRKMCDAAAASYQYVLNLSATSPAGEFAQERLMIVSKRQQLKVTSSAASSSGQQLP